MTNLPKSMRFKPESVVDFRRILLRTHLNWFERVIAWLFCIKEIPTYNYEVTVHKTDLPDFRVGDSLIVVFQPAMRNSMQPEQVTSMVMRAVDRPWQKIKLVSVYAILEPLDHMDFKLADYGFVGRSFGEPTA